MDMDLVIDINALKDENLKMIKEIENLKKKIEDNINLMQQNCNHIFIKEERVYGERQTSHCNICGLYA
jgi:hypothetical protein